jgi:multicomponent Na+:H+ antiporter subunit E
MMTPGVVAIPIRAKTDLEITLLANLISMTPGTLSLDVSEDRKTLYVHAMYVKDPQDLRDDITNNLERRVLEILR